MKNGNSIKKTPASNMGRVCIKQMDGQTYGLTDLTKIETCGQADKQAYIHINVYKENERKKKDLEDIS